LKPLIFYITVLLLVGCVRQPDSIPANQYQKISQVVIDSLKNVSNELYSSNVLPIEFDSYLKEAVEVAKNVGNNNEVVNIYVLVSKRYRNASKYADAIDVLRKIMIFTDELNSDLLKAQVIHEMAVNFRKINDNATALKFHIKALELAENANDTFLIHCSYNGIGNVYFDYKDYSRAIGYFHKSLQYLGKQKPNLLGEAINSNLLGEAWLFLGNTDSALIYLDRSFNANIKMSSKLGQAICHNAMGLVYFKEGEYNKAIQAYNKALIIFESLGEQYYQTMSLNNMGKAYMAMNKFRLAESYFTKVLNIAKTIGGKRFALDASIELAQLYDNIGKAHLSYDYSLQAIAYKDSITDDLQRQNTETMNVLYKAEKQEHEIIVLKQNAELSQLKMSRQRNIFIAGFLIAAIIAMLIIIVFRQRRLKSKLNEMGLEQRLLRARLNPHFVFNSLSAVQNFILHNDKKAASEYLVNFSRLMRNILMGSGTDFILLENELEILDDYLKLQRLRFQQKFDYFFEISDEINPENSLVPPMLIQPFIENAVEHGVRDIDRQGTIIIRFNKQADYLIIEVEDNGRGLFDQNSSKTKKGHISVAIEITKQRLQNLQAITKQPCKVDIIDNIKATGLNGVLVKIEIPYQEDN